MPLVRIAVRESTSEDVARKIGEVIYRQMLANFNVPAKDNFQIITRHNKQSLIYDASYLDIARTDGIVMIMITLNEGRTLEKKQAFYAGVANELHEKLGIRKEDVFINLVEVKKENWSFGNGIAQYAQ
jgi:phenylpyruvate tautomerase PptA (4-oxalocrotonate tautomerase family)